MRQHSRSRPVGRAVARIGATGFAVARDGTTPPDGSFLAIWPQPPPSKDSAPCNGTSCRFAAQTPWPVPYGDDLSAGAQLAEVLRHRFGVVALVAFFGADRCAVHLAQRDFHLVQFGERQPIQAFPIGVAGA